MPVIVRPQPDITGKCQKAPWAVTTARGMLRRASFDDTSRRILQTSFTDEQDRIVPCDNGFVETVLNAWEQDLHLELRPDDVWLAILSQLSFFVNAHAEELRHTFVAHEGRHDLTIDMRPQSLDTIDIGVLAQDLAALVRAQLKTPDLSDWLLRDFSTTLPHDRSTAAAMFLGTMEQYFHFEVFEGCGFPSVTLHGEREDWVDLAQRAARLASFGDGLADWSRCLSAVLESMVASFDRPDDADVHDFWMRASHSAGADASGQDKTLSGWLTAFCWWRPDGRRLRLYHDDELLELWYPHGPNDWPRLELAGVKFPVINIKEIPVGVTRVLIRFYHGNDHHEPLSTVLVAGSTGMRLTDASNSRVQPASGWWILSG